MKRDILFYTVMLLLLSALSACAPSQSIKTAVPEGMVWPLPPEKPRIKLIGIYKHSFDVEERSSELLRILGEETGIRLSRPHGIAADRKGNIYVTDVGYKVLKLYMFDFEKKKFRILGDRGQYRLTIPMGLDIDNEQGLVFVADSGRDQVVALDTESGEVKFLIGDPGTFQRPVSVAVDAKRQRVYVADTKLHMIKAFDYTSRELFTIGKGKRSLDDDGFNVPSQVALDREGNLYVADMFNRYIKVFDPDGRFIKKIGYGVGMGMGNFSKLVGVAVDSDNHIYALDTDFGNFQIFDQDNNLLLFVGASGGKPGRMLTPESIFIDEKDRIYVSDTLNKRIQVFQYLGDQ